LTDRLDGKDVNCATPMQGMWAMVVASAAQESLASGMPVSISEFISRHGLDALLNTQNNE
jgi:hypothetical protein